jgi:signal transduction histidine kinase/ligand-binding sensor domain-containing protein/DNA-binding response OmpR family regulator
MIKIGCFWLIMLLVIHVSFAQSTNRFIHLDQSMGLSNGSVTCMAQDQLGYMWIGTKNGVNKYDSHSFTHYTTSNSPLKVNDIAHVMVAKDGKIYISTNGGGLTIYDPELDHLRTYISDGENQINLPSNTINFCFQDSKSSIWIGTAAGLALLENDKITTFPTGISKWEQLSSNNFMSIAESNNSLWIGTADGRLLSFDMESKIFSNHAMPNISVTNAAIQAIHRLDSSNLLLGTNGNGLLLMNIQSGEMSKVGQTIGESPKLIRSIFEDTEGQIWVGSDGEGLLLYSNDNKLLLVNQYKHFQPIPQSLKSNAIYSLTQDNEGNIWIGYAWDGLSVLDKEAQYFNFYFSDFTGDNQSGVLSVLAEKDALWIGSDGNGLHRANMLTNGIKMSFLPGEYIQKIKRGPKGDLWVGTYKNGLYVIGENDKTVNHFTNDPENANSLSHNNVRDILFINDTCYLVSTWGGGLNLLNPKTGKWLRFRANAQIQNSLPHDDIVAVCSSDEGKIWIGTFGGGLSSFELKTKIFTSVKGNGDSDCSIQSKAVISLLPTKAGNLWVGTWGDGLYFYESTKACALKIEGTEELTVTAIEEDASGAIWISTKQGIYTYDYESKVLTKNPLFSGEFHINASHYESDGAMFFGNTKGAISFFPEKVKSIKNEVEVLFKDFKIYNESVKVDSGVLKQSIAFDPEIVLNYDQNVITIEYAALDYPLSKDVGFSVLLEGLHTDWVDMGTQRSATFSNLQPGEYVFKVRWSQGEQWSEESANLGFTIQKPWWKEWWAFVLYMFTFLVLLYFFRRYIIQWEKLSSDLRVGQIARQKEHELHLVKQRFFTNISHEIRTPVTLMIGAVNRIAERGITDKTIKDSSELIRKNGQHLVQLVNELLDFRKIESNTVQLKVAAGNVVKFSKEIFLSFTGQADKNGVSLLFESEKEHIQMWYDRDQMEKVIFNLLTNALKYTPAGGTVWMKIADNDEHIFIEIKDSGKGIKSEQINKVFDRFYQSDNKAEIKESGFGIGLSIVKDIVELHAGQISVESQYGAGTVFRLKLLHGQNHFEPEQLIEHFVDSEQVSSYGDGAESVVPFVSNLAEDYTILLVEDNAEIRSYVRRILEGTFEILEAENGKVALEMVHVQMPDLIISDVMMPEMDGITMTTLLKKDKRTSHIPIIILTARTALIYKNEGYEVGADEYITKPFNEQLLRTRVRSLLQNREVFKEKLRNDFLTAPKDLALNTPDQQFLEDITAIMEKYVEQNELKVEFIADELAMSHSVVYKKIKALTGQSLVEFVRDYRLKRGAQLITQYELSITEACYKVGFTDRKYFSQIFKQKFGMTPTEYAKKHAEEQ